MPILHGLDQWVSDIHKKQQPPSDSLVMRRPSEESIRTEDCEGPILDTPMEKASTEQEEDGILGKNGEALCTDRAELIERLKRGESPTWVPNRAVSEFESSTHIVIDDQLVAWRQCTLLSIE